MMMGFTSHDGMSQEDTNAHPGQHLKHACRKHGRKAENIGTHTRLLTRHDEKGMARSCHGFLNFLTQELFANECVSHEQSKRSCTG